MGELTAITAEALKPTEPPPPREINAERPASSDTKTERVPSCLPLIQSPVPDNYAPIQVDTSFKELNSTINADRLPLSLFARGMIDVNYVFLKAIDKVGVWLNKGNKTESLVTEDKTLNGFERRLCALNNDECTVNITVPNIDFGSYGYPPQADAQQWAYQNKAADALAASLVAQTAACNYRKDRAYVHQNPFTYYDHNVTLRDKRNLLDIKKEGVNVSAVIKTNNKGKDVVKIITVSEEEVSWARGQTNESVINVEAQRLSGVLAARLETLIPEQSLEEVLKKIKNNMLTITKQAGGKAEVVPVHIQSVVDFRKHGGGYKDIPTAFYSYHILPETNQIDLNCHHLYSDGKGIIELLSAATALLPHHKEKNYPPITTVDFPSNFSYWDIFGIMRETTAQVIGPMAKVKNPTILTTIVHNPALTDQTTSRLNNPFNDRIAPVTLPASVAKSENTLHFITRAKEVISRAKTQGSATEKIAAITHGKNIPLWLQKLLNKALPEIRRTLGGNVMYTCIENQVTEEQFRYLNKQNAEFFLTTIPPEGDGVVLGVVKIVVKDEHGVIARDTETGESLVRHCARLTGHNINAEQLEQIRKDIQYRVKLPIRLPIQL